MFANRVAAARFQYHALAWQAAQWNAIPLYGSLPGRVAKSRSARPRAGWHRDSRALRASHMLAARAALPTAPEELRRVGAARLSRRSRGREFSDRREKAPY